MEMVLHLSLHHHFQNHSSSPLCEYIKECSDDELFLLFCLIPPPSNSHNFLIVTKLKFPITMLSWQILGCYSSA